MKKPFTPEISGRVLLVEIVSYERAGLWYAREECKGVQIEVLDCESEPLFYRVINENEEDPFKTFLVRRCDCKIIDNFNNAA